MDKGKYLVSIIVPAICGDDLLERCLKSIVDSSYKNVEVFVVDDASIRSFRELVEGFGFSYIRHERNKGAGAARNSGASQAKGDLLLFVDSDIELYEDTIQKIVNEFKSNSKVCALTALISAENRFKNFISQYKTAFMRWSAVYMKSEVAYICTSCAAIKKEIFDETGGFVEHYKGASWEDTEMGLKIIEKNSVIRFSKNIEVRHNKKLSFKQLVKSDYKRTVEFIGLLFAKKKQLAEIKKRGLKISSADKGAAVALVASYLIVGLVAVTILLSVKNTDSRYFSYLFFLASITIIIYSAGARKFLEVCYEVGGFWFSVKAFFLYFFLNLIYGVAVGDGVYKILQSKIQKT